ncbi:DUF4817 domain-containing protein [Trichonephila clavipes]|nr:DUF4817 domain-containing protein [Trichonephila clavipes]
MMFARRGGVLWNMWSGIFVFPPVSISNMLWSRQQRAFAVETYFSNGRSVIAVQHAFRRYVDIPRRERVPDRKCVLVWVDSFRATGNVSKERG